jgi:hypothetical protein
MDYNISIGSLIIGIIIYLLYDTYIIGAREYVRSGIDGHEYLVRSLPDKQGAADLLATVSANLQKLLQHLEKMAPSDTRTQRLILGFKPENMCEGVESSEYTSYSVNKGEKIIFCLRQKNKEQSLVDINTVMFVAIHECGHICTVSIGHTKEFWDNFSWLLEEAIQIGIYTQTDYKSKPVEYCGTKVTSSPLDA